MKKCVIVFFLLIGVAASSMADGMKLIDYPLFIVIDQEFRLLVETPLDTPPLSVKVADGLELYHRRALNPGDTVQRFYFRANKSGKATVIFKGAGSELKVPLQILTWEEMLEPRMLGDMQLPRIWPLDRRHVTLKQKRNLMSDADFAAQREKGAKPSEKALSLTLDEVYTSLIGSHVPRNVFVNKTWGFNMTRMGCPNCGLKIYEGRSPFYPWLMDPENHPFKLGCPSCGKWFPSNDYAAGDMSSGDVVDDGYGVDFDGYRMGFVGYYTVWYYIRYYLPMVRMLTNEYARTGDVTIARKAAVGMFRIAEQYLNLAINLNQREQIAQDAIWNNKYGIAPKENISIFSSGLYNLNCWGTSAIGQLSNHYEVLFDYLHQHDEELLTFCRKHNHPAIKTMEDFRRFIETGFFGTVAQSFMDLSKIGNLPEGPRALINFAKFMGTPEMREIIDWVYNGGGEIRFFLTNHFHKDGSAYESQGYNVIHVRGVQEIIDGMQELRTLYPELFVSDAFPGLEEYPKYKLLFDFAIDFSLIDRTDAYIGDHGSVAETDTLAISQVSDLNRDHYIRPYEITHDRRFAQVLYGPDRKIPDSPDERLKQEIRSIAAEDGWEVKLASNVTDGYGHAILRSGEGGNKRAFWVRYGRSRGHIHDDMLTIGLEAFKRKLLPELGYPRSWTYRRTWEGHRLTHYTGLVRGEPETAMRYKGSLSLFAVGDGVQAAGACAPLYEMGKAPQLYHLLTDRVFERVLALIDLSETDFYTVDVFRMSGGNEHWWSFHGPRGEAALEGVQVTEQKGGTALGEECKYGEIPEQWKGLESLSFMQDVEKGKTGGPWSLSFALEDYPDVHLRTTVLEPSGADLILAHGSAPGGGVSYNLQWAFLANRGDNGLRSRFVQVMEAYEGSRLISSIAALPVTVEGGDDSWASALQVTAGDRTDVIAFNNDPNERYSVRNGMNASGSVAFYSEASGVFRALFLAEGTYMKKGEVELNLPSLCYEATIISADYPHWKFVMAPKLPSPDKVVGRYLRIVNDGGNDTAFRIEKARNVNNGTEITVDVDPRIGEGYTASAGPNLVDGSISLPLGIWRYYQGKTLANHDGTVTYRTSGCYQHGEKHVSTEEWISFEAGELHPDLFKPAGLYIDPDKHGTVSAERLRKEFVAPEGDSPLMYTVYDFGVGDTVLLGHSVSVTRKDEGYHVHSTSPGTLKLPGVRRTSIMPGETLLQ